jgi:hypothetical protein
MNTNYYIKYKKYKQKYLNKLKTKIHGGSNINKIIVNNEDIYIGSKSLKNYNNTDQVVYFVLEKLNQQYITDFNNFIEINKNNLYGLNYLNSDNTVLSNLHSTNNNYKRIYIGDGLGSFKKSLELFNKLKSHIYIAYSIQFDPTEMLKKNEYSEIIRNTEMFFSVFINESLPISSHTGIFRNINFWIRSKNPTKKLSIYLHAFSAKASKMINNNLKFMINNPALKMRDIFIDFYKIENKLNNIWIGSYKDRISEKKSIDNEKELKNYSMIDSNFQSINTEKLIQKNLSKFNLDKSTLDYSHKIIEYFNNIITEINKKSDNDLEPLKQETINYIEYLINNYIYKKIKSIDNEKELENYSMIDSNFQSINTEKLIQKNLSKLNLDKSTLDYSHKIIEYFNNIITEINKKSDYDIEPLKQKTKNYIEYLINNYIYKKIRSNVVRFPTENIFIPEDISIMPPLMDIDEKWYITYKDEQIQFDIPDWIKQHNDFGTGLYTCIFDLDVLESFF